VNSDINVRAAKNVCLRRSRSTAISFSGALTAGGLSVAYRPEVAKVFVTDDIQDILEKGRLRQSCESAFA